MKSFTVAFLFVLVLALAYGQEDFAATFESKAASVSDAFQAALDKATGEDAEYLKGFKGRLDEIFASIRETLATEGTDPETEEYFNGLAANAESILVGMTTQ